MRIRQSIRLNSLARELSDLGATVNADYLGGYDGDETRQYLLCAISLFRKAERLNKPIYEVGDGNAPYYPAYFVGELNELIGKFRNAIIRAAPGTRMPRVETFVSKRDRKAVKSE